MSIVKAALARDRIGTPTVVQYALTSATALLAVAGLITTGWAVTGIVPAPLVFVLIASVVAIFIPGYAAVISRLRHAGALYACITAGLGRPAGVAAGLMSTYVYNLLQIGLYGLIGVEAATIAGLLGADIPWWVGAGVGCLVCAICGVLRVDLSGRVLAVVLMADLALLAVFIVLAFAHPHDGHVSLAALSPSSLLVPGLGVWVAVVYTAFCGFEQPGVLSEEARDPGSTVRRAMWLSAVVMATLYVTASLAMTVAAGPGHIVDAARQHGPDLLFVMLGQWTGQSELFILCAHILFLASIMAGAVSYHASCARYMYALGREGVLPRRLGDTGRRTGAPVPASLTQSTLGAAAITLFAVMGWDPLTRLFFWLGTMGGAGLLILLTVTSIAVVAYTVRCDQDGPGIGRGIVLPLIAALLMAGGLVVTGQNLPVLLGVDPDSRWLWIWPATFAAVIIIGLIRAVVMRRDRHTYRQIGAGVTATTVPTPASTPAHAAVPQANR
ncbi:amino acid permease [Rhizocola hellebori]|uniref:Amino acid permease n=1 Tax=Rhizocola hellebori TaxID=1392758 RepID=A0A8J3VLI6_9ACTN|nr:APC family permease [Rhizocola hellebori]GIH10076.1 amino acid permease [Rhizocola hellebori]